MASWPKNKDDLTEMLMNAFKAGCWWGYAVELAIHPETQEELGAKQYVGLITSEEAMEKKKKLIEGCDP